MNGTCSICSKDLEHTKELDIGDVYSEGEVVGKEYDYKYKEALYCPHCSLVIRPLFKKEYQKHLDYEKGEAVEGSCNLCHADTMQVHKNVTVGYLTKDGTKEDYFVSWDSAKECTTCHVLLLTKKEEGEETTFNCPSCLERKFNERLEGSIGKLMRVPNYDVGDVFLGEKYYDMELNVGMFCPTCEITIPTSTYEPTMLEPNIWRDEEETPYICTVCIDLQSDPKRFLEHKMMTAKVVPYAKLIPTAEKKKEGYDNKDITFDQAHICTSRKCGAAIVKFEK